MQAKITVSLRARLKERWLLALFACPFAGIGLGFLLLSVLPSLSEWQSMKSWQQGSAFILVAEISTSYGDDSTTYEATAQYRYEYEGYTYNNNRVGITSGHDNIGNYQQGMGRKLELAKVRKTPVSVWINPVKPQDSVLNRNLRWKLFAFKMLFILIFGGVGFGILAYVLLAPTGKLKNADSQTRPWLSRREWASKAVVSNAKSGLYFIWFFAFIWSALSFPISFFVMDDYDPEKKAVLLVLLFPLVGLGLIALGIKQTLAWRRYGQTPFIMDPYPGAIGGQVGGTIDLNLPYNAQTIFKITLSCLHSYVTGTGKQRKHHESLVWQSQGFAYIRSWGNKTRLSILFDVDDNLPGSEPSSDSYHFWRLQVKATMPGIDFNRAYHLPVFKNEGHSPMLSRRLEGLCISHPEAEIFREQEIESILDIQQIPGGIEVYYPAFKQVSGKLAAVFIGLIFFGIGIIVSTLGNAMVFGVIFSLIGLPIALWGAYRLLVSLNVRIDKNQIKTVKKILGISVGGQRVLRQQVRHLCLKRSYSMNNAGEHWVYYQIQAITLNDKAIVVGYNLAGKGVAQQSLEMFGMLTGIPVKNI